MDEEMKANLVSVGEQIRDVGNRVMACDNGYHLGILLRSLKRNEDELASYVRMLQHQGV